MIKRTFKATTQFAKLPASAYLWKRFRTPHPACNVWRRNKDLVSNTIVFGYTCNQQWFQVCADILWYKTFVTNVVDMKTQSEFPSAFQDNVTKQGAPTQLLVDSAKVKRSESILFYLVLLFIGLWQSEPYHQH